MPAHLEHPVLVLVQALPSLPSQQCIVAGRWDPLELDGVFLHLEYHEHPGKGGRGEGTSMSVSVNNWIMSKATWLNVRDLQPHVYWGWGEVIVELDLAWFPGVFQFLRFHCIETNSHLGEDLGIDQQGRMEIWWLVRQGCKQENLLLLVSALLSVSIVFVFSITSTRHSLVHSLDQPADRRSEKVSAGGSACSG